MFSFWDCNVHELLKHCMTIFKEIWEYKLLRFFKLRYKTSVNMAWLSVFTGSICNSVDCSEVCSSALYRGAERTAHRNMNSTARHKTFIKRLYDQAPWQFIWGHEQCWSFSVISLAQTHALRSNEGHSFESCCIVSLIEFISQCITFSVINGSVEAL